MHYVALAAAVIIAYLLFVVAYSEFAPQARQAKVKLTGQRVVGIIMEAPIDPEAVDLGRNDLRLSPQPAELGNLHVADLPRGQRLRQRVEIELGIGPGSRNAADIDDQFDRTLVQQSHKLRNSPRGMANRINGGMFGRVLWA
jgi:hypothetical protein